MSVQRHERYRCDADGCTSAITVGDGCAAGMRYPAEWFVVRTGAGGSSSPPDRHACSEACRDQMLPGSTCWITGTGYRTAPSKGGGVWTPLGPCVVEGCGEPAVTWWPKYWGPYRVCQRCRDLAARIEESKQVDADEALARVTDELRWMARRAKVGAP